MAKPELGLKRQCMNCGAKFYDLSRDPAVCPKCGTVFQAGLSGSTRVAAPAMAARNTGRDAEEEDETETAEGDTEVVSLQDVEAEEAAGDESSDDESEEGGNGDDDTFLEEEEGDDDVSDLIDGDIENDEEG